MKHANSILESFEYFWQKVIDIDPYSFERTVSKLVHVLDTV